MDEVVVVEKVSFAAPPAVFKRFCTIRLEASLAKKF